MRIEAQYTLGAPLCMQGAFEQARYHLEQGLVHYDADRHHSSRALIDFGVTCRSYDAWTLWYLGYPDQAQHQSHDAIHLARHLSHPFSLGFTLVFAHVVHGLRREPTPVSELSEEALILATEYGFPNYIAPAMAWHGRVAIEQGQLEEGFAEPRQELARWRDHGSELLVPWLLSLLTDACEKTGRIEEDLPDRIGRALAMMGNGVHCVDVLHFLLDQHVVAVAALTDGQSRENPLERLATMCLRFDGGVLATVCCGFKMPDSKNDATLYGSDGRIVLGDCLRTTLQGSLEVVSDTVNTVVSYQPDPLALYTRQVEAFNEAIEQDTEPLASGLDGLRVVQATEAMVESASTGRTVKITPLSVA